MLGKVLTLILLERLQAIIEPQLMEAQCGFRKGCGTIDQIWVARQVVKRAAEYCIPVLMCFAVLTKADDSVDRSALVVVPRPYGVPNQFVDIIQGLYSGTWRQVQTADGMSVSCPCYYCFMDRILREVTQTSASGCVQDELYTADLTLTAETRREL